MRVKLATAWIVLALSIVVPAQAAGASEAGRCFFITQYQDWRAPDANTVYIRVMPQLVYKLGLSRACPALKWPRAHLIVRTRGGDSICTANDWILSVSMGLQGANEPCIVKTMTLLTPQQVDSLPRGQKP